MSISDHLFMRSYVPSTCVEDIMSLRLPSVISVLPPRHYVQYTRP